MYVWIGINVDDQLSSIKSKALEIDRKLAFKNSCFTLPMHVSLKISFKIDDAMYNDVESTLTDYYSHIEPFSVDVKGLEKENNILWIRMAQNSQLDKIHDDLNELLLSKYGVPLHEYDLDYKFHTSLFMDDDTAKIDAAYEEIKDVVLPQKLRISRFLICTSADGRLGTYSVIKEILR